MNAYPIQTAQTTLLAKVSNARTLAIVLEMQNAVPEIIEATVPARVALLVIPMKKDALKVRGCI